MVMVSSLGHGQDAKRKWNATKGEVEVKERRLSEALKKVEAIARRDTEKV